MRVVELLSAVNVLIALLYYTIAALILLAPLRARWIRALGYLWAVPAASAIIFFAGCATHHIHMAHHADEYAPSDLWHLLLIDSVQPIAALVVVALAVARGEALLDRLLEVLVRKRPEVIERLVARLTAMQEG